jgi:hypothetical protein
MIKVEDTGREYVTGQMGLNMKENGIRTRSTAKDLTL